MKYKKESRYVFLLISKLTDSYFKITSCRHLAKTSSKSAFLQCYISSSTRYLDAQSKTKQIFIILGAKSFLPVSILHGCPVDYAVVLEICPGYCCYYRHYRGSLCLGDTKGEPISFVLQLLIYSAGFYLDLPLSCKDFYLLS